MKYRVSLRFIIFKDKIKFYIIIYIATIEVYKGCRKFYFAIIIEIAIRFNFLNNERFIDDIIYINYFWYSNKLL